MITVKHTVKKLIMWLIVITVSALALFRARSASNGVVSSLSLCIMTVVPSLLPFMVLSTYMVKSGMASSVARFFEKPCRKIFCLPGAAACIIIMSIIGGFPVGARMIASAVEEKALTKSQGRRMMLFCVNAGPAFIINAVGESMLGSKKAGAILLAATVTASLVMGFFTRFFKEKNEETHEIKAINNKGKALAISVESSVETMLIVCGWILVFGALRQIIDDMISSEGIRLWTDLLCEVTSGCEKSTKTFPLAVTAFVLGFSGFAVHAQVLPFAEKTELKYKIFFAARILNGATAAVTANLLFKIFPCEVQVFSSSSQIVPVAFSVSAYASAAAIFTVALIILDLAPKRKV